MLNVIVIIHLLIAIAMVALILLQKTEGGASGGGFSVSASVDSMMRPRARPNPIGRATSILGICFFVTSLGLALLTKPNGGMPRSIMAEPVPKGGPAVPKVNDLPSVPTDTETPAAPAAPEAPK